VGLAGRVVDGHYKPSSETPTHTLILRECPDTGAIVHTHSLYAVVFAVLGQSIPRLSMETWPWAGRFWWPTGCTRVRKNWAGPRWASWAATPQRGALAQPRRPGRGAGPRAGLRPGLPAGALGPYLPSCAADGPARAIHGCADRRDRDSLLAHADSHDLSGHTRWARAFSSRGRSAASPELRAGCARPGSPGCAWPARETRPRLSRAAGPPPLRLRGGAASG